MDRATLELDPREWGGDKGSHKRDPDAVVAVSGAFFMDELWRRALG